MNNITNIRNKVLHQFNKGCTKYQLLQDEDRIVVALSGGKDSMLLARLLAERARIFKPSIKVVAVHVVMDNVPYSTDLDYLQNYCTELGLPLRVIHTDYDESTDHRKTHCFLCAHYRRRALFDFATQNNFNKVALGHHQDDILVTALMNMTFEGSTDTMHPIMPLSHWPLKVIRPLCLVRESWIKQITFDIKEQKKHCPYESFTRRHDMEAVFKHLEQLNPEARHSLWHALLVNK